MASLLKRGNKYYVRIYVNGKAKDIATKTSNIKIAEKLLQKVEYENATGQLATATKTPLAKLLEDFAGHLRANHRAKSVKNDLSRLRMIFGLLTPALEFAAKKDNLTGEVQGKPRDRDSADPPRVVAEYAEQIAPPLINRYLDQRAATVGPKTLNADREILYRLFRYAIEHHGLAYPDPRLKNPVDGVRPRKLPAHDIRFLNPEQIKKQLDSVKDELVLHAAVAVLIYAGLPRSFERGPIEAIGYEDGQAGAADFRVHSNAAPLKHDLLDLRQHVRGPLPRSFERGPIEAFCSASSAPVISPTSAFIRTRPH